MLDLPSIAYAYDTGVLVESDFWLEAESEINEALGLIAAWFNLNKLNLQKTVFMTFVLYADSVPKSCL